MEGWACSECGIMLESAAGLARHQELFCTRTGVYEVGQPLPVSVRSSVHVTAEPVAVEPPMPVATPGPAGGLSRHDTSALLAEVARRRAGAAAAQALDRDITALVAKQVGRDPRVEELSSDGGVTPPNEPVQRGNGTSGEAALLPSQWRQMDPKLLLAEWQQMQARGGAHSGEAFLALEERVHALRGVADTAAWSSQRPTPLPAAIDYSRPQHGRRAGPLALQPLRESRDDLTLNAFVPSHPAHGVAAAPPARRVVSAQGAPGLSPAMHPRALAPGGLQPLAQPASTPQPAHPGGGLASGGMSPPPGMHPRVMQPILSAAPGPPAPPAGFGMHTDPVNVNVPLEVLGHLKHALEVRGERKLLDDVDALAIELSALGQGAPAHPAGPHQPFPRPVGGSGMNPVLQVQLQGLVRRMNDQMATTAALIAEGGAGGGPLQAEVDNLKRQLQATREAMQASQSETNNAAHSMRQKLEELKAQRELARMRLEMQREEEEYERERRRRMEEEEDARNQKHFQEEQRQQEEAMRMEKARHKLEHPDDDPERAARRARAGAGVLIFFDRVTGLPKFGPHVKSWPGRDIRLVFAVYGGSRQITPLRALVPSTVEQDPVSRNHKMCFCAQQKKISQLDPTVPDQHLILSVQLVVKKPTAPGEAVVTTPYAWSVLPLTSASGSLHTGSWRVPLFYEPVDPSVVPAEMDSKFIRLEDKGYNSFGVRHQACIRVVVSAKAAAELSRTVWDDPLEKYEVPEIYQAQEKVLWGAPVPAAAPSPPPAVENSGSPLQRRQSAVVFVDGQGTNAASSFVDRLRRRSAAKIDGGGFVKDNAVKAEGQQAPVMWLDVQPVKATLPSGPARTVVLLSVSLCLPQTQTLLREYQAEFERLKNLPGVGGCLKLFSWSPGCVGRTVQNGDLMVEWTGKPSVTCSAYASDSGVTPLIESLAFDNCPAHRFPIPAPFKMTDLVLLAEFSTGEVIELADNFLMWGTEMADTAQRTLGWTEVRLQLRAPPVLLEKTSEGGALGGRRKSFKSLHESKKWQHEFVCMVRVLKECQSPQSPTLPTQASPPAVSLQGSPAPMPARRRGSSVLMKESDLEKLEKQEKDGSDGTPSAEDILTTWSRGELGQAEEAASDPPPINPDNPYVFPVSDSGSTIRRLSSRVDLGPGVPPYPIWLKTNAVLAPVHTAPKSDVHISVVGARFLPSNVCATRVVGRIFAALEKGKQTQRCVPLGKPFAVYQNVSSDVLFPTYTSVSAQASHHIVRDVYGKRDVFCLLDVEAFDAVTMRSCVVGYVTVPLVADGEVVQGARQLRMRAGPLPPKAMTWGFLDDNPIMPLSTVLVKVMASDAIYLNTAAHGAENEYAQGAFETRSCEPTEAEHEIYRSLDYKPKEMALAMASRLKGQGATDPTQFTPKTRYRTGARGSGETAVTSSIVTLYDDHQARFLRTKLEVLFGPVERMPLPLIQPSCITPFAAATGVSVRMDSLTGLASASVQHIYKIVGKVYCRREDGGMEQTYAFMTQRTLWRSDISHVHFKDDEVLAKSWDPVDMRRLSHSRSFRGSLRAASARFASGDRGDIDQVFIIFELVKAGGLGERNEDPTLSTAGWYPMSLLTSYSFAPNTKFAAHGTFVIPFFAGDGPPDTFMNSLRAGGTIDDAVAGLPKKTAPVKWFAARVTFTDGLRAGELRGRYTLPKNLLDPKYSSNYNQVPFQDIRLGDAFHNTHQNALFRRGDDATKGAGKRAMDQIQAVEDNVNRCMARKYNMNLRADPYIRSKAEASPAAAAADAGDDPTQPLLPRRSGSVRRRSSRRAPSVVSDTGSVASSEALGTTYRDRIIHIQKQDGKVGVKFLGREVTWVKPGGAADVGGMSAGMFLLNVGGTDIAEDAKTATILPLFAKAPTDFTVVVAVETTRSRRASPPVTPEPMHVIDEHTMLVRKVDGKVGMKFVGRQVTDVVPGGAAGAAGIQAGMTMVSVHTLRLDQDATSGVIADALKTAPEQFYITVKK